MRLMIGTQILKLDEIESTNMFCRELIEKHDKKAYGFAVAAFHQTAGRGQRGNSWQSEPGKNLIFSVIVDVSFIAAQHLFSLTKCVSVAICEFLKSMSVNAQIKWPNDIYYNNKKLGGILIETLNHSASNRTAVIGIGLNINQINWTNLPHAISLCLIKHEEFDLDILLNELLNFLDAHFLKLKANINCFENLYLESLLGYKKELTFTDNSGKFKGVIEGVNDYGKLLINKHNTMHAYDNKEIIFEF